METFASFSVEQQKLYGLLHLPDGSNRPTHGWPAVALLHDFQSDRHGPHRLLVLLARYLAARGVATLRFDFRGSGESQGDFSQMTTQGLVSDTLAAGEYLRRQPELDPERLMLLGLGMGGMVAALSAREFGAHRLALVAPALPERWLELLRGGHLPPVISDIEGWAVGREFLQDLPRLNPLKAAREFGGVAHVFCGDQDEVCPPQWSVRYAQALGCGATALPEAGHTFDSLEAVEQVLEVTGGFLLGR